MCYDGRGYHYGYDGSYILPASAWPAGTSVWQAKVKGTGTHFLTTMCSYGAGWQVAANHQVTSTGTITVASGSTTATGNGTAWDGTQNSLAIAIFAKHGGVPFMFWSYAVTANGTSLTLARPFPSDADPGTYSYSIFSDQRRIVLHYTRADSTDGYTILPHPQVVRAILTCISIWDGITAMRISGILHLLIRTWMALGYVGDFSPNYYDMGLAHYAFYFRSGLKLSLNPRGISKIIGCATPRTLRGTPAEIPETEASLAFLRRPCSMETGLRTGRGCAVLRSRASP